MNRYFRRAFAAVLLTATLMGTAMAQNAPKPATPLKIQIVISRYEGDKKVSSLPYILAVTANDPRPSPGVSLSMGSQVPVPVGQGAVDYKNVGTNIDCMANSTDDGRFQVEVRIEDSSIVERRSLEAAPTLRTFVTSNAVVLRDGQTAQFTAAADKVTGEVVRVDVTMTVEK